MAKKRRNPVQFVSCPCCAGSGKVELSSANQEALKLLRKRKEAYGAELAEAAGCEATTMNNRLSRLVHYGLATKRRDGRKTYYKATV